MELKLKRLRCALLIAFASFNRTSMELKHFRYIHDAAGAPFNRTSMELKRIRLNQNCLSVKLLIEPVWN